MYTYEQKFDEFDEFLNNLIVWRVLLLPKHSAKEKKKTKFCW